MIVETDPVADDTAGMLQRLEAMAMDALSPDQALDQAVLLRRMRRDELLSQAVAAYQGGIAAAREDQAVVGAQEERRLDSTQGAEAGNQGMLQRRFSRLRLGAARQMPAEQFAAAAVRNQRQDRPAVQTRPDPSPSVRSDGRLPRSWPRSWAGTRWLASVPASP